MTSTVRKIVKSMVWRLLAFLVLTIISYFITGSIKSAGTVAISYTGAQIALYYFHERFWDRVRWGRLRGVAVQFTGLPGAGKTTIAQELFNRMTKQGHDIEIIDGDEYRINLCSDLGFSRKDRIENIRRLAFVAHKIADKGKISVIAAINPYEDSRKFLKEHSQKYMTVFVNAPLDVVVQRDTKGLYKKALLPVDDPNHIPQFTGISDPFDKPIDVDVCVDTHEMTLDACVRKIEKVIKNRMK